MGKKNGPEWCKIEGFVMFRLLEKCCVVNIVNSR